jgi:energy-converting hydrogenase Eha subunit A
MANQINIRKFAGYALIAAVINSVIFLLAKSANAAMTVKQAEIKLSMVFAETLIALIVASVVASLIGKISKSFNSKMALIGAVFGVVSAIAPLTSADDSKTGIALALNHIVAGALWYVGVNRSTK